ncbi:hypothetical protein BDA96_04G252100 [Sorghum bicolor]|uniref:Uncharacterized protein n=1 Tax=Sorghum bicolor TaxID=4558 RepID=A0A921R6G8_SORBI|nr:hypothetical protein BDA96_04G252100 [Sorghum bicolor]
MRAVMLLLAKRGYLEHPSGGNNARRRVKTQRQRPPFRQDPVPVHVGARLCRSRSRSPINTTSPALLRSLPSPPPLACCCPAPAPAGTSLLSSLLVASRITVPAAPRRAPPLSSPHCPDPAEVPAAPAHAPLPAPTGRRRGVWALGRLDLRRRAWCLRRPAGFSPASLPASGVVSAVHAGGGAGTRRGRRALSPCGLT